MTPPLSAPFTSAPLLPAVIWFLVVCGGIDYCLCVSRCGLNSSTMALTLAPFLERSPSLMVHFVGVYFTPNDDSGSPPLGRHHWAASQRPETVCRLRCFAAVRRQLLRTMNSLCFLDAQGKGCMKYLAPAWVVRATMRAQKVPCAPTFRD